MKKQLSKIVCLGISVMCLLCACGSADSDTKNSESKVDNDVVVENEEEKVNPNIQATITAIDEIGEVSLESKGKIEAAVALYNKLTVEEQSQITNYANLEAAQAQYDGLAETESNRLIDTYSAKFDADYDKVEGITWYMHKNMPEYIDERCYIIPYLGVRGEDAWICIRYNYTESDWIFWESLTIVADGQKYTEYVGSFNTVRDNDGGVVWEWYDKVLNVNVPMENATIQMMETIANSTETIIRFQGDDYSYDLTVTDADKQMIRDALELYRGFVAY